MKRANRETFRSGRSRPHVVLVRHGETEWSRDGRHTGRTDVPLTEVGRREARMLAARLRVWRFAEIVSSPLRRALETCRLAGYGDVVEVRDELLEWDYGDYEGRTTADIRTEHPGWTIWAAGAPGGERAEDVGARVDPLVAELREAQGDVAVFGHGHLLRVLAARWLDLPAHQGRAFALGTTTVSVLGFERETPVILRWNEDCHLGPHGAQVLAPESATEGGADLADD
ncbi:MAG TPA: histidine phosphatase family protein [Actinomycetota bacterium]|nr:histidine phosphatase family protein [Actinomycetota bacterium]